MASALCTHRPCCGMSFCHMCEEIETKAMTYFNDDSGGGSCLRACQVDEKGLTLASSRSVSDFNGLPEATRSKAFKRGFLNSSKGSVKHSQDHEKKTSSTTVVQPKRKENAALSQNHEKKKSSTVVVQPKRKEDCAIRKNQVVDKQPAAANAPVNEKALKANQTFTNGSSSNNLKSVIPPREDPPVIKDIVEIEIEKPSPILCNLCQNNIQPMDEVYYRSTCEEQCRLFLHKLCLQDNMSSQGFKKKREYKDASCPTEGCRAPISIINEFSMQNVESLYIKHSEKSVKKNIELLTKKEKPKEKKVVVKGKDKPRDITAEEETEETQNDAKKNMKLGQTAHQRGANSITRSLPLPVDIDNVVLLSKPTNELENKYAVAEQPAPQPKAKIQKRRKGVLDIEVGIRADTRQSSHLEESVANEAGNATHHDEGSDWGNPYPSYTPNNKNVPVSNQFRSTGSSKVSGFGNKDIHRNDSVDWNFVSPMFNGCSVEMDSIAESISDRLSDLVLNTPRFQIGANLPVVDLKNSILLVAGDQLNQGQMNFIENLFANPDDSSRPTDEKYDLIRSFVSKLKYFTASKWGGEIIYCKNKLGRDLEDSLSHNTPSNESQVTSSSSNDLLNANTTSSGGRTSPEFSGRVEEALRNSIHQKKEQCRKKAMDDERRLDTRLEWKLSQLNLKTSLLKAQEHPEHCTNTISLKSSHYNLQEQEMNQQPAYNMEPVNQPNPFAPPVNAAAPNVPFYSQSRDGCVDTMFGQGPMRPYYAPPIQNVVTEERYQAALDILSKRERLLEDKTDSLKSELKIAQLAREDEVKRRQEAESSARQSSEEVQEKSRQIADLASAYRTTQNEMMALKTVCARREVVEAISLTKSSRHHIGIIVKKLMSYDTPMLKELAKAFVDSDREWEQYESALDDHYTMINNGQCSNLPTLPPKPSLPASVLNFFRPNDPAVSTMSLTEMAEKYHQSVKPIVDYCARKGNKAIPHESLVYNMILNQLKAHKGQVDVHTVTAKICTDLRIPNTVATSSRESTVETTTAVPKRWEISGNSPSRRMLDLARHECLICLEVIGKGNSRAADVLSCPGCTEPYHSSCVRKWLAGESTCPRCRHIWPDPVDFPGLSASK